MASAQVNHNHLKIELIGPDSSSAHHMPPIVRILWRNAPTVVDPKRFPDVAAAVVRLFASAATRLAQIKAHGG